MSETQDTDELVAHTHNGHNLRIYREVDEFFKAKVEADREVRVDQVKADIEYNQIKDADLLAYLEAGGHPDRYDPASRIRDAYDERRNARAAAEAKHQDAIEPRRMDPGFRRRADNVNLWAQLKERAQAAGHKEIVWVLEHTLSRQPYETEVMLHYLPNTPDVLWQIGKEDHSFCSVFDTFMGQAEAAGIFDGTYDATGMKEYMALQSWVRRNYGASRQLNDRVMAIMKAMREDSERKLASAKATWQGMDEAYAENTSRKRSEAAARRERNEDGTFAPSAGVMVENEAVAPAAWTSKEEEDAERYPAEQSSRLPAFTHLS